ncbi:MAG: redoxin domain-containing protein [Candidatus Latescibacterota bacterium]
MTSSRGSAHAVAITLATGILLGTCVFLGAKITNPPPLDWMDVEFYELVGQPLPAVALQTVSGAPLVDATPAGVAHVVVLLITGCRACDEVYPSLREASRQVPLLLVGKGQREEFAAKVAELGLACPAAFDSAGALAHRLGVMGYPTALLVDRDGRIVKVGGGGYGMRRILELAAKEPGRSVPSGGSG